MVSFTSSDFEVGTRVTGLVPGEVVTITMIEWDDDICELTCRRREGQQQTRMMYPGDWDNIEIVGSSDENRGGFGADEICSKLPLKLAESNLLAFMTLLWQFIVLR